MYCLMAVFVLLYVPLIGGTKNLSQIEDLTGEEEKKYLAPPAVKIVQKKFYFKKTAYR